MMKEQTGSDEITNILRDMREEYWRGVTETEEARSEALECVTFVIGGESYAFETALAAEVIRIPKLVRLPKVPEIIRGVFNLRGDITAAVDIRRILGLSAPELTPAARIIVVKAKRFMTGLIVEGVRGVEPLPMDRFEPATRSLGGQREFIRGQFALESGMLMLLDIGKILESPEIIINMAE